MAYPVQKTDEQWRAELTPEQYEVLRRKGTEPPGSGQYLHATERGMFQCVACGADVFHSDVKFDSGTGWPSFTEPANRENIELVDDTSLGIRRTEVLCRRCGGHLGHVFDDGPVTAGGQRYCINSAALNLQPEASAEE